MAPVLSPIDRSESSEALNRVRLLRDDQRLPRVDAEVEQDFVEEA